MADLTFIVVWCMKTESWVAGGAFILILSISRLTSLTRLVTLNTVTVHKREAWSALNTLVTLGVNTHHTGWMAGMLPVRAIITHPLVLANTGTLSVVVCVFNTILTVDITRS